MLCAVVGSCWLCGLLSVAVFVDVVCCCRLLVLSLRVVVVCCGCGLVLCLSALLLFCLLVLFVVVCDVVGNVAMCRLVLLVCGITVGWN